MRKNVHLTQNSVEIGVWIATNTPLNSRYVFCWIKTGNLKEDAIKKLTVVASLVSSMPTPKEPNDLKLDDKAIW